MAAILLAVVIQHADDASALDVAVLALMTDADAFSSAEKATPAWITFSRDLVAAKAKADRLSASATTIAHTVEGVSSAVADLEKKAEALDTGAHDLEADAGSLAASLRSDVAAKETTLQASVAEVSTRITAVQAKVATGTDALSTAAGNAKAGLNSVERQGSAAVANAANQARTGARNALRNAQDALDKANDDYAQTLAVTQIAQAHQLPGGNASGVDVQNGAYVYGIAAID
jgi:hypothetical protein